MTQKVPAAPRHVVSLTDAAVAAARRLLAKAGQTPARKGLRIEVEPGGGVRPRYQVYFDDLPWHAGADRGDEDSVVWFNDFAVLIDLRSGPCLQGSVVDFTDRVEGQGFTIDSPHAQGGCACGDSRH